MVRPLDGVRVLELSIAVAGPVAGHILGDLGAEVLKIEAPFGRSRKPSDFVASAACPAERPWDRVPKFNELNRSKKSVVLDLSRPQGKTVFLDLVARSDVVLVNFSARVLGNLGLDHDVLRATKPNIILVAITGFGNSGPYRDRLAYGPGIDAMSGLAFLTGYSGGSPMKAGNHYYDQHVGVLAALATMAALRHRRRTGAGQRVDIAMFDAGIQTIGEALVGASLGARVAYRIGNRDPQAAPHGVYRCRGEDRWIAIAVWTDAHWRELCAAMDRPDLAADARLGTLAGRLKHRDHIDRAVADWCAGRDAREVQRLLQERGVPAGAVLNPAEMLEDPHLKARVTHPTVHHPDLGASPVPAVAWHFQRAETRPGTPAPRFGQHTDEVLCGLLGMSEAEVAQLRAAGVTVGEPVQGDE